MAFNLIIIIIIMTYTIPLMNLFLVLPVVSLFLVVCNSIPEDLQALAHLEAVVVVEMPGEVKSKFKESLSLACHILCRTFCKQKPNVIIER